MFLEIKGLLTPAEVARLTALSREVKFVEGRISNPANTSKDNLQADLGDPKYQESTDIVAAAFARSREFNDFAMPKRIAPPLLCRYEPGMKYGAHADAALIPLGDNPLRSDISCTIFIAADVAELERRLRERATESTGEIDDRIALARHQLEQAHRFRYMVRNDDVVRAGEVLSAIVERELVLASTSSSVTCGSQTERA